MIFITVILLTVMYGVLASKDIESNSEKSNIILSKTISNVLWPQIQALAKSVYRNKNEDEASESGRSSLIFDMIKVMLDEPINEMVRGTNILQLELYTPTGQIIYTTDDAYIEKQKRSNFADISRARNGLPTTHVGFLENYLSLDGKKLNDGYVLSSSIPVKSDSNQVEGIFVIYSDVTDVYENINKSQINYALALAAIFTAIFFLLLFVLRKFDGAINKNIELAIARDSEADANKEKSLFLANMSHELRTPLNAIIGYSELLREDCIIEGISAAEQDLSHISSSAKHLLYLINEILDLSKVEAGQMTLSLEDLNVEDLINNVLATIKPLAEKNNNTLFWNGEKLPFVHSDGTKIRQILLNLLSNAAKFTESGVLTLRATIEDSWLVLRVEDSGIGMTGEQLDRLFTPFMQADESTTRKYGGTGLGLSISKQFSELMGGSIMAQSTCDIGTTFTVKIPANFDKIQTQTTSQALVSGFS